MPAKNTRRITAEDLYRFYLISDCQLSPDGRHVVFAAQRVDRKTEKKYSNLWVVPADGGEPRQFTYGDQNDGCPRWSPDGETSAFVSNHADEPDLDPDADDLFLSSIKDGASARGGTARKIEAPLGGKSSPSSSTTAPPGSRAPPK